MSWLAEKILLCERKRVIMSPSLKQTQNRFLSADSCIQAKCKNALHTARGLRLPKRDNVGTEIMEIINLSKAISVELPPVYIQDGQLPF